MKIKKPIAVHVDRLDAMLTQQGVHLKRTKVLELLAAALGYHNVHECTAASERGDLTPPPVEPICRVEIPGGEALIVVRDPNSNAPYGIDESFIEQVIEEERREAYGPSPYGGLMDLTKIASHRTATSNGPLDPGASAIGTGTLRILVELEVDGPVTESVILDNVRNAIVYQRAEHGLSGDDDEGMVGQVSTRILKTGTPSDDDTKRLGEQLGQIIRETGRSRIHVALIHHSHGIDVRLGTTLASVSRQVAEYARENWDEAWENDQVAARKDRIGLPEDCDGLDDDEIERMYFAAMSLFDATDYVDYSVIEVDDEEGLSHDSDVATAVSVPSSTPFPGVPADLWEVYAARDGDTFRQVFRVKDDEDPEVTGRKLVASAFGLDVDDYVDDWLIPNGEDEDEQDETESDDEDEEEPDYSSFDADLDGIAIDQADFDPELKAALKLSWEAASRLPEGDPLRDRIVKQVMDAMPTPGIK